MATLYHFFLDLETLGVSPGAVIVQIGIAVVAIRDNKDFIDKGTFLTNVDIQSQLDIGLHVEGRTLEYWFHNAKNISWLDDPKEITHALYALNSFIHKVSKRPFLWCNLNFDYPILETAYKKAGIKFPFDWTRAYDTRTILHFTHNKPWSFKNGDPKTHNALDDAKFARDYVLQAYSALKEAGNEIIYKDGVKPKLITYMNTPEFQYIKKELNLKPIDELQDDVEFDDLPEDSKPNFHKNRERMV